MFKVAEPVTTKPSASHHWVDLLPSTTSKILPLRAQIVIPGLPEIGLRGSTVEDGHTQGSDQTPRLKSNPALPSPDPDEKGFPRLSTTAEDR